MKYTSHYHAGFSSLPTLERIVIATTVKINPQNIRSDGISEYKSNPKINAAKGSAPDRKMDDVPESMYFKLNVEKIYGSANEKVECTIKKITAGMGPIPTKWPICLKSVNGIRASERNTVQ